jgi:DNA-binding MltR family transcriptional regulator
VERYNKDTGHAIVEAARLDALLRQLLLYALPPMSNGFASDLFDNGALGTFSAKIDLARGMGLIDDTTRSELRAIKNIRNLFAHSEAPLCFTSPKVFEKVKKLPLWREEVTPRMVFDAAVHRMELAIDSKIDALRYEHATGQWHTQVTNSV